MRDVGLKTRKERILPTEKLLDILCTIYPEDLALELHKKLMQEAVEKSGGKENAIDKCTNVRK